MPQACEPTAVCTVGELARRHGVDKDRIAYVIRSRRIRHVGRAGRYRLFDEAAVDQIGLELQRIATRREALAL